jgi:hypothetical protein
MAADSGYDGKSKSGALTFIQRVESYAQQVHFKDDRARILFAIGYLSDAAAKWATCYVDPELGKEGAGSDWGAWRALFLAQFGDSNPEGTASDRLFKLKQGDHTSLGAHISYFKSIRNQLPMGERDTHLVYTALRNSLRQEYRKHVVGFTGSVDALVARLNEIDHDIDWAGERTPRWVPPSSSPVTATANRPPHRDPNAMDVDALKRLQQEKVKLVCTRCGGVGHLERNCGTRHIARVAALREAGLLSEGESKLGEGGSGFV